jgi:bacterioferritin-associated ferredoxin
MLSPGADEHPRQEQAVIVCQCRRVTDRDVRAAVARGASDLADLARTCGAGTDCRGCRSTLETLLADERIGLRIDDRRRLPVVVAA